jgi:glycolate oxidase
MELGPAYTYLRDIKQLFDPADILNPGSLFDTAPICTHMELTPMLHKKHRKE